MKRNILLFTLLLSLGLSFAAMPARAGSILFAHVSNATPYVNDGNRIRDYLSSDGHTVTTAYLNTGLLGSLSGFDQIFVYDLSFQQDLSTTQVQNYSTIASWYNNLANKNLILDGRIISSDVNWAGAARLAGETALIQNYATQLELRGGGLVLGTDHDAFQSGINNINAAIGVNEFHGFYYTPPLEAIIDPLSPLAVAELVACSFDASAQCVNDNSSTGFVATGLQANGQTLTPFAYHGNTEGAWDYAAISTTMGSLTFGTCGGPGQDPCGVPEPTPLSLLGIALLVLGIRRRRKSII